VTGSYIQVSASLFPYATKSDGPPLLGWQWFELSVTREIEDKQILWEIGGTHRRIENRVAESD